MACHESIKDLLHKSLGLNDTGFSHRLSDDQSDSRGTLELSSTVKTVANMLSWKDTGFAFFCVLVVLWPSEKASKCFGFFSMSFLNSDSNTQKYLTVTDTFQVEVAGYKTNDLSLDSPKLVLNTWDYGFFFPFLHEMSWSSFFHGVFASPSISTSCPRSSPINKLWILVFMFIMGLGRLPVVTWAFSSLSLNHFMRSHWLFSQSSWPIIDHPSPMTLFFLFQISATPVLLPPSIEAHTIPWLWQNRNSQL